MKNVLVALMAVTMVVTPTLAADSRFIGDNTVPNGNVLWSAATSWADLDADGTGDVPVDGNRIVLDDDFCYNGNWGIDVTGAALNLPGSSMGHGYGGRNWSIYDSATLTPNANPLGSPTDFTPVATASLVEAAAASTQVLTLGGMDWSKSGTPRFFVPVVVNGTMTNPESGAIEFYGPATIGTDGIPRNNGWRSELHYYGDATIGTKITSSVRSTDGEKTWFHAGVAIDTVNHQGGYIYLEDTATGTINTMNLSGVGVLEMKGAGVAINTLNWTGGTISAGADGVLPSTVDVPAAATLSIGVPQTTFPTINVAPWGALLGDMTGATYGAGNKVNFQENAILAVAVGDEPTEADLGLTAGVKDALLFKGVTDHSDGVTTTAGDDGNSVYKGLCIYKGDDLYGTLNTVPGEELTVTLLSKARQRGATYRSDQGVANVYVFGPNGQFTVENDVINSKGDEVDEVKTFNLIGSPSAARNRRIASIKSSLVDTDMHITISNGVCRIYNNMSSLNGSYTVKDRGFLYLDEGGVMTPENIGSINFEDNSGLRLEALDYFDYMADEQVTVAEGARLGVDLAVSGTSDMDVLLQPQLHEILKAADIKLPTNTAFGTDGLLVGDNRFAYGYENTTISAATTVKPYEGATSFGLGIHAWHKTLKVEADVIGGDATLMVGSSTHMPIYGDNTTDRVDLAGAVTFSGNVTAGKIVTDTASNKRALFSSTSIVTAGELQVSGFTRFESVWSIPVVGVQSDGLMQTTVSQDTGDLMIDGTLDLEGGAEPILTVSGTLSGSGNWVDGGGITVLAGGKVAPGSSVGTLTGESVLTMESGVIYALEIADTAGVAGVSHDIVWGTEFDFDSDGDDTGALTLEINAAGDSDVAIGAGDTFVLFAMDDGEITLPTTMDITYDATLGGSLTLQTLDVDGDGDDDSALVLTGMVGVAVPANEGSMMGDANGDGLIDDNDLSLLLANWGKDTDWAHGEFSGETPVNDNDLSLLLANWTGSGSAGIVVPEPASLGLLALGALVVLRRRRK